MKRGRLLALTALWIEVLAAPCTLAQEWTRFRGPNGSGLSDAKTVPLEWTEKSFRWNVELPGPGHSQPVIWGERIFLLSATPGGEERYLSCLRFKDGSIEWTRKFPSKTHGKHERNTYATSTAAVDADRVYFVLSNPDSSTLNAVDPTGKDLWSRDLGPHASRHAGGASPVLYEDLVVLANEIDEGSYLLAVDRKSGDLRWKIERKSTMASYATPCLVEPTAGKPELVFSSNAYGLYAVDPRSGALLWDAAVFDKRTVSSPVAAGGLVWATCGSGGGGNYIAAIRPGGKGDVTGTNLAHKLTKSIPYVPTPVASGDLLFLWSDIGVVSCVEISSGKVLWQERVRGSYSGSPVCVDGRLYCMSEEGDVPVVAATREFKLLARNPLGEGSRSTPAVAQGRLLLRTYKHLICVGG